MEIYWSNGSDGHAELYLDNSSEPSLAAKGPNMHHGYQHYWKVGPYRHPDIRTDNRIDIADLRIRTIDAQDADADHTDNDDNTRNETPD